MQSFGSVWTIHKLTIIEKYLDFYTKALYGKFKICYIDAFAGSGYVKLEKGNDDSQLFLSDLYDKNESLIDGSAIRSLKYPFNKFTFFEKKRDFYIQPKERIDNEFYQLNNKISVYNTDCNEMLMKINIAALFFLIPMQWIYLGIALKK